MSTIYKNTKELKIENDLWTQPKEIVNLKNFDPNKISVHTLTDADLGVHYIEYDNYGFHLTLNNLKGYFDFNKNYGQLNLLFDNNEQKSNHDKICDTIISLITSSEPDKIKNNIKNSAQVTLFDRGDLPVGYVFNIGSIIIVIKSIVEKNNKFFPQLALRYCSYNI